MAGKDDAVQTAVYCTAVLVATVAVGMLTQGSQNGHSAGTPRHYTLASRPVREAPQYGYYVDEPPSRPIRYYGRP